MENSWWWGIDRKTKTSSVLEVTCLWLAGGLIYEEFHFLIKYNFETCCSYYEGIEVRPSLGKKYMPGLSRLSDGRIKQWAIHVACLPILPILSIGCPCIFEWKWLQATSLYEHGWVGKRDEWVLWFGRPCLLITWWLSSIPKLMSLSPIIKIILIIVIACWALLTYKFTIL